MTYRELLAISEVRRLYAGWSLARLPNGANITVILLVATHLSSLAVGGLAAATYSIGVAVGTFAVAPTVRRIGPSRALSRYAVVQVVAQLVLAATAAGTFAQGGDGVETTAAIGSAAVVGLSLPPSSQCLRALWGHLLPPEASRTTGSLEGATTNVIFIVGPALAGLTAAVGAPAVAPVASGAASLVGCLTLATAAPMRRWSAEARTTWPARPHWSALTIPGVRQQLVALTLVMASAAAGDLCLFDVGVVNRFYGGGALLLTAAGVVSILASMWHGTTRLTRPARWWLVLMVATIAGAAVAAIVLSRLHESDVATVVTIAMLMTMQVPISVLFIDLVLVVPATAAPSDRVAVLSWRTAANLTGNGIGEAVVGLAVAAVAATQLGSRSGTTDDAIFAIGCALVAAALLGLAAAPLSTASDRLPRHRGAPGPSSAGVPG